MHKSVATKHKRVIVDRRYSASAASSDVREHASSLRVIAEATEVKVIDGRRLGLVECWTSAGNAFDKIFGR